MKDITRRRFLNQSLTSAAAVGGLATAARAADSAVGANERMRFAVVGAGGQGRADIRDFFQANENLECAVICDVDDAMLAKTVKFLADMGKKKPETEKDWRKVVDRKDIDIVLVATPDHWHPLPTIHACQAGKDVYCEKPLANSIGECRVMADAIHKTKRVVQMGTQWRAGKHWGEAVEFVHSGKLGKIRLVRCWTCLDWYKTLKPMPDKAVPPGVDYDMWLGPARKRPFNPTRFHFNFRWWWDYAGGLMTDWGVHLLNIALWGMKAKAPRFVSSTGGHYISSDFADAPDTQCTLFEFPKEKFTLCWEHHAETGNHPEPLGNGVAFYGVNGKLVVNDTGWWVYPEKAKKDELPALERKNQGDSSRVSLMKDFFECVRTRNEPMENAQLGQFVSSVAHLGNLALRTGKSLEYDHDSGKIIGNEEAAKMIMPEYRAPWELPKI
jgi:predicted dehydrogenase